jgi:predicted Zn-dependent peptidase
LKENAFWLSQFLSAAQIGEEAGAFLRYPSLIDALTSQQIQDAAKQYLRKDNYVRVSLYPER